MEGFCISRLLALLTLYKAATIREDIIKQEEAKENEEIFI